MVKVLKATTKVTSRKTDCKNCGSWLEYTRQDCEPDFTHYGRDTRYQIICGNCRHTTPVDEWKTY